MARYAQYLRERKLRELAMAGEPPPTESYVRAVILKALDERSGEHGDWTVEGPLAKGRDSWIFKARTPLAKWPLAVKVYCASKPADLVAKSYRDLQRYHLSMAGGRDTVPAPWAVLPEHRTHISEWIDYPVMGTLLSQAGRRREERAALLAAAGQWLGCFHRQAGISFGPLDHGQLQWHVDRSLGGTAGAWHAVGDGMFRHGYTTLVKHAETFADTPVGHTTCHGDFTPTNLFLGPDRTVGFDFGAMNGRPVTFDICRFVMRAEANKPFATRKADLSPQGLERRDQEAFMASYGPLERPLEGPILSYLCLAEALRRWATLIEERRGSRFSVTHWVRLSRLRRMVGYAARHLEQTG